MKLVQLTVNPTKIGTSGEVSTHFASKNSFDAAEYWDYEAPFAGLKFITKDEDRSSPLVSVLLRMLIMAGSKWLDFEEDEAIPPPLKAAAPPATASARGVDRRGMVLELLKQRKAVVWCLLATV